MKVVYLVHPIIVLQQEIKRCECSNATYTETEFGVQLVNSDGGNVLIPWSNIAMVVETVDAGQ